MGKLTELRIRKGLSGPQLARLVGAQPPEIWRLEKYPEPGGRRMTLAWAERLAPALDVKPQDLLFEDTTGEPYKSVSEIPVRGEVAANKWLEDYEFVDESLPPIPAVPGRYQTLEQFAYRVVGPCMESRRIYSGDYVICVPYFDARQALTDGDIVVAERRRGQLTERTCKELKIVNGGFELWPRTSHPQFQTPIRVANYLDPHEEDGTVVEVVGLVIGRFSPV